MDLLKVSNDIEEALKKEGLVLDQVNDSLAFWPEEMKIDKCM